MDSQQVLARDYCNLNRDHWYSDIPVAAILVNKLVAGASVL